MTGEKHFKPPSPLKELENYVGHRSNCRENFVLADSSKQFFLHNYVGPRDKSHVPMVCIEKSR